MGLEDFEWDPENVPLVKLGLHIAQVVFAFVVFCLEISVFRDDKAIINGNNAWPFAVCFLSIPAWIFLTMAPRYNRTRKFAEPHAMTTIDAIFTIFWLAAFASQAAYNTANSCGDVCSQSKAIVGMAFFVTLFFALTLWVSIYSLQYYNWNGRLPGYDKVKLHSRGDANDPSAIDPDKAAFSMAPHDEEAAYGPVHADDHDHDGNGGGERDRMHSEGGAAAAAASNGRSTPQRYGPDDYEQPDRYGPDDYGRDRVPSGGSGAGAGGGRDNVYDDDYLHGQGATGNAAAGAQVGRRYNPPSAQDDFDDERPAQFPAADYHR